MSVRKAGSVLVHLKALIVRIRQQVALEGFAGVSPGEYLGKLIVCLCTVLNPAEVIL